MFSFLNHEKNKPVLLCSKTKDTKDKAVEEFIEKSDFKRDMQSIFNAAHVIRDDIIQMRTADGILKDIWTPLTEINTFHTLYIVCSDGLLKEQGVRFTISHWRKSQNLFEFRVWWIDVTLMDKNKLFHIRRALHKEQDQNAQDQEGGSVLIIDACPRASRNESFKTCLELSAAFMASMTKFISRYITVHLVFANWSIQHNNFIKTTRGRHKSNTGRTSYTCKDSTPIRMYLKVFLSESKTKVSLTNYTFLKKHSIITQNSCSEPI